MTSTFDTDLVFGSSDPASGQYILNNFDMFTSPDGTTWTLLQPTSPVASTTAINTAAIVAVGNAVNLPITVANADVLSGMTIVDAVTGAVYGTVTTVSKHN